MSLSITSLMTNILSTKPPTWSPTPSWISSPEISAHTALWHITSTQWALAWEECKTVRRAAEAALLKAKLTKDAREKYGCENPYAWPGLDARKVSEVVHEDTALSSFRRVDSVLEAPRGLGAHGETLEELYGGDGAGEMSRVQRGDAGPLTAALESSPALTLVLDAGAAARRNRGKQAIYVVSSPYAHKNRFTDVPASNLRIPSEDGNEGFVVRSARRRTLAELEQSVARGEPARERVSVWGRAVRRVRGL